MVTNELIGNLITYKHKREQDFERNEPKKERSLVPKANKNDSIKDEHNVGYLT